jgi:DNA-binding winged helix-turn-helix (wHTH) protein
LINRLVKSLKSVQRQGTCSYQVPSLRLCTEQCVTCPKQYHAIYFNTNVFVTRHVLSVAETTHRISNPMFRVLCAFHEYVGEVVSREFLLAYGWGIKDKVNNNVTVAISELRALLKNITDLEIITIHGKGYQLVNKKGLFK